MDLQATANVLELIGQTATLRRFVGRLQGRQDVTVKVQIIAYQAAELTNNIAQGDQHGIMSNREIAARGWPGPPKRGDLLILANGVTKTIEACDPLTVGEIPYRYDLQLRGA